MNTHTLVLFFGVGAAGLALWTDARFPKLMPGGVRWVLVHFAAAFVLSRLMIVGVESISEGGDPLAVLGGVFGLALPSLVYVLLVAIWVIKFAQRALYRRTW